MGLEPIRPLDTTTSTLPVCQFQHDRTYLINVEYLKIILSNESFVKVLCKVFE